jgi:hypothetical protein
LSVAPWKHHDTTKFRCRRCVHCRGHCLCLPLSLSLPLPLSVSAAAAVTVAGDVADIVAATAAVIAAVAAARCRCRCRCRCCYRCRCRCLCHCHCCCHYHCRCRCRCRWRWRWRCSCRCKPSRGGRQTQVASEASAKIGLHDGAAVPERHDAVKVLVGPRVLGGSKLASCGRAVHEQRVEVVVQEHPVLAHLCGGPEGSTG